MTIILENINKKIENKILLQNINVNIEWGKCYAFVGPKYSGKSMLLKIFMGLEQPDSGKINRMGDYKYPTLQSAFVSQHGQLNMKKSALWNVRKAHKFTSKEKASSDLLRFLTEDKINCPISELSIVERRFVEIVKAAFTTADFIVMDEPFAEMSDEQRQLAINYILDFRGSRPLLITSNEETDLSFAKILHLNPYE